jgi:hypothetical protein
MKRALRFSRRPLQGLGLPFALALALIATVVVLLAPQHQWGPGMWPFYVGTTGVLLWVAVDLWNKVRNRQADTSDVPNELSYADTYVEDVEVCPLCFGARWMCEDHPAKPWRHGNCAGAAVPCACNPEGVGAVAAGVRRDR